MPKLRAILQKVQLVSAELIKTGVTYSPKWGKANEIKYNKKSILTKGSTIALTFNCKSLLILRYKEIFS